MGYSLQKSTLAKLIAPPLVMMVIGCSSAQDYKHQVSGKESYLNVVPLKALNAPANIILPVPSGEYEVPVANLEDSFGKQIDICPPVQLLPVLRGSHEQHNGDCVTVLLADSLQNTHLWSRVVSILQAQQITIVSRRDDAHTLTTDWVKWTCLNSDQQYQGSYQISVQLQGDKQALVVQNIGLQQIGESTPVSDLSEIQRYNAVMMNHMIQWLDQQDKLVNFTCTAVRKTTHCQS